jgi:hypothetical protein
LGNADVTDSQEIRIRESDLPEGFEVDRVSSGLRDYTRCGMYMRWPSAIWLPRVVWGLHHVACATKNVASSAGSGASLILFAVLCELSVCIVVRTTEASRMKKRKEGRGVLHGVGNR